MDRPSNEQLHDGVLSPAKPVCIERNSDSELHDYGKSLAHAKTEDGLPEIVDPSSTVEYLSNIDNMAIDLSGHHPEMRPSLRPTSLLLEEDAMADMPSLRKNKTALRNARNAKHQNASIMDYINLSMVSPVVGETMSDWVMVHPQSLTRTYSNSSELERGNKCKCKYFKNIWAFFIALLFCCSLIALIFYTEGYLVPEKKPNTNSNGTSFGIKLFGQNASFDTPRNDTNAERLPVVEAVNHAPKIIYPPPAGVAIALGIAFLIALAVAMSQRARCIALLTLPGITTSRGRAIMLTIILRLLPTGPITNTLDNAKKIPEATSCQVKMLSQEVRSIQSALLERVHGYSREFEATVRQMFALQIETLKKIIDAPKRLLGDAFGDIGIDVSGINASVRIHNITLFAHDLEDYSNKVDAERYFDLPNVTGTESLATIGSKLNAEFADKTYFIRRLLSILGSVLSVSVVLVLIQACCYHRGYQRHLDYDNIYVTSAFKELDTERRFQMKKTLLPLRRKERAQYIDSTSCCLSGQERVSVLWGLIVILPFLAGAVLLCLLDFVLYRTLEVIREEANVTVVIDGGTGFKVSLNDTSPRISQLLYQSVPLLFKSNSTTFDYFMQINTERCLPDPLPPFYEDTTRLGHLIAMFGGIFILTILQSYGARLQHKIAAAYYPVPCSRTATGCIPVSQYDDTTCHVRTTLTRQIHEQKPIQRR
ncbi:unnamed protein product [Owenia fusiformis]|uniref:Uncharacterized protein n=1 Tax=Owenia fusiformis TaxID=6347 RepID=A0A8J1UCI3_OWEFU|nr:unnamed protein product [Owenia fusiformis]